ncbi:ThiF family adenylyltransferase [Halobacillus sp. ACCC02827]|nr:ThiF family adenylyltransferase [Halobacillus sp. ACCC02827]WJE14265.1 ThiF family adenylyltransferase [Halobacillus sp. ACCC02827]
MINDRYSRQMRFKGIGENGQHSLANKHVLIIGAGALGCAAADMLARAGVGKLTIVDRDYVEWSNLTRQHLYTEDDVLAVHAKAKAAEQRLAKVNSCISVEGIVQEFHSGNAEKLMEGVDLVMDATDNFHTRFLINDVSAKHSIPWIYGGCVEASGGAAFIDPEEPPCLQCLKDYIDTDGGSCDSLGIIGPAVQMTASYQTVLALQYLTGKIPNREWIYFNVWEGEHASISLDGLSDEECPSCSESASYPYLIQRKKMKTAVLCGRDTVQVRPIQPQDGMFENLRRRLSTRVSDWKANSHLISFSVDTYRFVLFKDGRALIHGVKDAEKAQLLYHKYIET